MLTRQSKKGKDRSKDQENAVMATSEAGQDEITPTNKEIWKLLLDIQANTTKLLNDNQEQRRLYEELKDSLNFETERRGVLESKVASLEKELREAVSSFNISEAKRQQEERKLDDLQQYSRKYNLEISGVPRNVNLTDKEVVLSIAEELKVDINERDVDIVHRLNSKKGTSPIIIRFTNYTAKQKLYKAKKHLRNKDWSLIFGESMTIYFNENLTQSRGKLYKEVRATVKAKKYYSCWTIDGKIFVKKTSEATPKQVNEFEDINKL